MANNKQLAVIQPGQVAPFDLAKPPALPAVLKEMEGLSEPSELVSLTQQMLGSSDTTEFDLLRYRVGRGGSTNWTFEEFGEESTAKELDGVMLATGVRRAFYAEGFGQGGATGAPPDCASDDAVTGFGILPEEALRAMGAKAEDGDKAKGGKGFSCHDCPFSQFGSAINEDGSAGRGQRCKMARPIYFLGKDERVPSVIVLPPASLGNAKKFLNGFMRTGTPLFGLRVKVALEKHQGGGFPHARATFSLTNGSLQKSLIPKDDKWFAFLMQLSEFVKDSMLPAFKIEAQDVSSEDG